MAEPMDVYSPPLYQRTMEPIQVPLPTPESNETYWSMEDIWSMQLFNGD